MKRIDVAEPNMEDWFASDCVAENVRTVIRKVEYTSCSSSQTNTRMIEANESIISLLVKCHSKLGGRDAVVIAENGNVSALQNRIGDGAAFVEKTLLRIAFLGDMCRW